jgi:hypothetical protein
LSKHREALRRGIRSLIHDTSRELADLEGRELPAEVDAPEAPPDPAPPPSAEEPAAAVRAEPIHAEIVAVDAREAWTAVPETETSDLEPPVASEPVRALEPSGPAVPQAPRLNDTPLPSAAGPSGERSSGGPRDELEPAAGVERVNGPATARPEALTAEAAPVSAGTAGPAAPRFEKAENIAPLPAADVTPASEQVPVEERTAEPAAPATAGTALPDARPSEKLRDAVSVSAADVGSGPATEQVIAEAGAAAAGARAAATQRPARKRRARRGSKRAARRETAPTPPEDTLDGVDPAQAQSRKGVCVAFFVDHACWHIPNAYCNTALHVCVRRNCPVYHLHQLMLERRFASKYRHFW